jgi:hypothetical protein
MDYDLIVVKTLERVYKNYYYIIRGKFLWHPSFFMPVWNGESLAGIVMPFCPQSNEPVNITGFHILKVPAFKVSLYGGNLFWWIAAHKYQVVRIMLSFKTEQIQIPDILNKIPFPQCGFPFYRMRDVAYVIAIPLLKHTLRFNDD